MASQKHLRELLRQDQEPFHLHNYIADRRNSHLNKPKNKPVKPLTKSTSKRTSLYKQACFTSFQDSPDFLKSPLKKKNSGTVLHVPAKTAAGLLEAATKIHNQSSSKPKNVRFAGLFFGSILRKLKDKNTTTSKTRELSSSSINGPVFEAKQDHYVVDNSKDKYEMGYAFSDCNYSNISRRISSAGWSEINTPEEDNKSIDMDTISSCTTSRSDFYTQDFVLPDQPHFCLSPLSPFRFALHRSPSVGRRTPEFLSPSTSPCHHRTQEDGDQATGNLQNQTQEEDEKDQCSPVSVLDLPFADDVREDGREEEEEEYEDEDDYDLECSYALMQKAKFQLLEKLRRFERLAELEPIELEKRMLEGYEDEDDDDYYQDENEEHEVVDEFGMNADDLICNILSVSSPCNIEKIPGHTKRLVSDLVAEEKKNGTDNKNEAMVKMVCKRLDSWKEVESNTIDMMVELDLIKEFDGWKSYDEEVGARAKEIELAILGVLIEEISEELVSH